MRTWDRAPSELLAAAAAALCVAYFALWACAPAATIRPDLPMRAGQSVGIGVGAAAGLIGRSNCRTVALGSATDGCASGQLWVHFEPTDWFQLGVVGFAGDVNGAGAGPYARFRLVTEDNVRMAIDVSGGLAWFAGGLPIALRVSDALWVYTEPSVGMRIFNAGRLPVGLAMDLGVVRLHAELGLGTGSRDIQFNLNEMMGYGSAGMEFGF